MSFFPVVSYRLKRGFTNNNSHTARVKTLSLRSFSFFSVTSVRNASARNVYVNWRVSEIRACINFVYVNWKISGNPAFMQTFEIYITNKYIPWRITTHVLLSSPVTSHQSPVTSHQSPVTSHQSPVTSHQSPVTSHQSPVTSHQSPVTSHQSPVTSHQSPVTSHQSPVTSHQSPVTSHQSPVTSHQT